MYAKEHCGLCTALYDRLEELNEELEDAYDEQQQSGQSAKNNNNNNNASVQQQQQSQQQQQPRGFKIETVDITKDQALYERYKYTIPVLFIDNVLWKEEVTLDRFERSIDDFVRQLSFGNRSNKH